MKKTIYILDYIMPQGWGGVSLADIHDQMKGVKKDDEVEVLINSGGGDVFEGIAIFNYLRDYNTTTRIIGLAGSIASIIALSGKKILMGPAATYMVHEPWGMDVGDEAYKRNVADQLATIKKAMVEAYQTRMPNKSEKEILDWLKVEKFITGKEAKALGLADEFNIKPQEGNYSNTRTAMRIAAMVNMDGSPTTENKTTIINNEVPVMVTQEQFDTLQNEFNNKVNQINTLNSSISDFENKVANLEKELKEAKNEVLISKMETYTAEETAFVDKLIENKQVEATHKDFLINDLVDKRLASSQDSYNSTKDFLSSKPVNPLTQPQATNSKAGATVGGKIDKTDFENKDKADQILAAARKLAKDEGISLPEALDRLHDNTTSEGGE
ncbi:Clp protease ClpP [Candidatus Dojkabacteria bacterium]|uniref:ATP-dependent Clp protease proteolytic subunit n=1 Tax=Candidatus Dojkabacteria bacterium TaxID=2099670 RepID=A0A955L9L2_9BACT|nr:Clp protease ClpP [Candidatus Dojkabacteria bacterium]